MKGKCQKMTIFGFLADENSIKLIQITLYMGVFSIKLKIIFPVYMSTLNRFGSDLSVPTGEG